MKQKKGSIIKVSFVFFRDVWFASGSPAVECGNCTLNLTSQSSIPISIATSCGDAWRFHPRLLNLKLSCFIQKFLNRVQSTDQPTSFSFSLRLRNSCPFFFFFFFPSPSIPMKQQGFFAASYLKLFNLQFYYLLHFWFLFIVFASSLLFGIILSSYLRQFSLSYLKLFLGGIGRKSDGDRKRTLFMYRYNSYSSQ